MSSGLITWANQKAEIALALAEGHCGGTYAESVLVLSAAMSGIASLLWPGENVPDRKRFVELWASYASTDANLTSIPLLIEYLDSQARGTEATVLRNTNPQAFGPGYRSRVITGADVDLPESSVLHLCPTISL